MSKIALDANESGYSSMKFKPLSQTSRIRGSSGIVPRKTVFVSSERARAPPVVALKICEVC